MELWENFRGEGGALFTSHYILHRFSKVHLSLQD